MAYYKNKSQGSKQVSRTSIVILENKNNNKNKKINNNNNEPHKFCRRMKTNKKQKN